MLPDAIIQFISSDLLADNCNPLRIQNYLQERLDLSEEEARQVLYSCVRDINISMFPAITKMELFLTEKCNLQCAYCFEKDINRQKAMSLDVAFMAVDFLLAYSGSQPKVEITFFGGEPCLEFSKIRKIVSHIESVGSTGGKVVELGMTSNGTLLSEDMLEFIAEKKINVLLSIDGLQETHDLYRKDHNGNGSYATVMTGMERLKKFQPWIGAKLTVMPETAGILYDNILGLYKAGVNQFIIGAATGVNWEESQIVSYCTDMKRLQEWYLGHPQDDLRIDEFKEKQSSGTYFGCQSGRNSLSVSTLGEISGCSKILSLNNEQLIAKLGDVRWGLTNIRNRAEMIDCAKLKKNWEELGIDSGYQGGCFASNYEYSGDIYSPDVNVEKFHRFLTQTLSSQS